MRPIEARSSGSTRRPLLLLRMALLAVLLPCLLAGPTHPAGARTPSDALRADDAGHASPAQLAPLPAPLPAPVLVAESGGRLGAVASDGALAFVAQHSRVLMVDPAVVAGGQPLAVSASLGAPIQALAARPGWLLALTDGLHVLSVPPAPDPNAAMPPRSIAHVPLRRPARDVVWVGDQAWLRSLDVIQRVDLSDPAHPRTLPAWRPDQPSDVHAAPFLQALQPFGDGALLLLASNSTAPNTNMLGELLYLQGGQDGTIEILIRHALPRCCLDQAVVAPRSGRYGGDGSPWAIAVDSRGAAWSIGLALPAPDQALRFEVTALPLPGGLSTPSDLAWNDAGLWWGRRSQLHRIDPADPGAPRQTLRLLISATEAGPRLSALGNRLLVATHLGLRWADLGPRLLAGPAVDTWPAAELDLGGERLWMRGTDGSLRWGAPGAPNLGHPPPPTSPTGDVPESVTDLAAGGEHVYVVRNLDIHHYRDLGEGRLVEAGRLFSHDPGNAAHERLRLWDADGDLLAVNIPMDQELVARIGLDGAIAESLFTYHGSGPTALALEGDRLHVLCATPFGGSCWLNTYDLLDRSITREPPSLPLPAAPPPAPSIGYAGDLVGLGLGRDLVLAHMPMEVGAAPTALGQIDLPGPILEIALDEGPHGPGSAAWVLSDGTRSLSWLDLSDPSAPLERARTTVAPDAASLVARDGRAWLVSDGAVLGFDPPALDGGQDPVRHGGRLFLPLLDLGG